LALSFDALPLWSAIDGLLHPVGDHVRLHVNHARLHHRHVSDIRRLGHVLTHIQREKKIGLA
jgi:hypothetical protein